MNQKEYSESRERPELRKPFLRRVFREIVLPSEYGRFISGVGYSKNLMSHYGAEGLVASQPSLLFMFGASRCKSRISVGKLAFERIDRWADLQNVILYHEGKHAEHNFYSSGGLVDSINALANFGRLDRQTLIQELEAYRNQLEYVNGENSFNFTRKLEANIWSIEHKLEREFPEVAED